MSITKIIRPFSILNLINLVLIGYSLMISSCGSNNSSSEKNDSVKVVNNAVADSINNAFKQEIAYLKKDSIESIIIKSYSVKLISGKHKFYGKTKVEYMSLWQVVEELKLLAKKEMWTNEDTKINLDAYKSTCKGGQIRLKIERLTIDAANTDNITIIIRDLKEKELYRESLASNIANYSQSSDNWWNIKHICIDSPIKPPFFLYIVDQLQDEPFKYEVTPIMK